MLVHIPVLKMKHTTTHHAYYVRHQWPNDLNTYLSMKRSQVHCSAGGVVILLCKKCYLHCTSLPSCNGKLTLMGDAYGGPA